MDIITLLQMIPDFIFTSDFAMACILVFFVSEALFKIPYLSDMDWGKPVTAIIVGAVIGVAKWGISVDALILGVLAGGITTLVVNRLDRWLITNTGSKKKK